MKKNTTQNNLYWICILKFRKIQIITYIYNQNELLTKISPNPIKTAVKTIYTWLIYKIHRNIHAKYKMTSIIKLFDGKLCSNGSPLIITASSNNIIEQT